MFNEQECAERAVLHHVKGPVILSSFDCSDGKNIPRWTTVLGVELLIVQAGFSFPFGNEMPLLSVGEDVSGYYTVSLDDPFPLAVEAALGKALQHTFSEVTLTLRSLCVYESWLFDSHDGCRLFYDADSGMDVPRGRDLSKMLIANYVSAAEFNQAEYLQRPVTLTSARSYTHTFSEV